MIQPLDWPALVAETIRRRKEEGLTQAQHAALAGVGRTMLIAFDQGDTTLSLGRALAILRVVGLVAEGGDSPQDAFLAACRQRWEALVARLPPDHPSRHPLGHYGVDTEVTGITERPSPRRLLDILERSVVRYTGWPPFRVPTAPALAPVCDEDGVACWLGNPDVNRLFTDAGLSDYWRASTDGRLYLQSGYQEDGSGTLQPGRVFDVILPIWRAGELLAHAAGFARAMGAAEDAGINLRLRYTGLEGRDLVSWAKPADRGLVVGVHRSRLPEAHLTVRATPARVAEDLPGLVHELLAPLYDRFDGYVLDRALVEREVQEMESRKRP